MQVSVLASGSSGNATYFESDGAAVLVDCGLTVPELRRRLASIGRGVDRLRAVFLTHDHGDHVGSSVALCKRLGLPLYATAGTLSILKALPPQLRREIKADEHIELGPLELRPFATPHDGLEPVGFRVVERGTGRSAGIATDLGYVSRSVVDRLAGVELLVVELNHDERMLIEGPYAPPLKRRILSPHGHLSNEQGAALASHLIHDGLQQVVLAHLSETNNTPDHARRAFERVNAHAPSSMGLHIAEQRRASPVFELRETA